MSDWRLKRVTSPDPVTTVAEVKEHLRIDGTEEDALLSRYIDAATDAIEGPYGIGVLMESQQWEYYQDRFTRHIQIPLYPIISVDSIEYVDEAGNLQALAVDQYRVDTISNPARINTAVNVSWPPTLTREMNAVKVTFTGGHEDTPEALKAAVIMWVAHMYEVRQPVSVGTIVSEIPMTVESILGRYRVAAIG